MVAVICTDESNRPVQNNRGISLRASGQSRINHAVSSSGGEACHLRLDQQLRLLEDDNPCCVLNETMTVEVSLAMLHQQGRWLLQLRNENPRIVAPGCWGLFGGHLEAGETPLIALRRELEEEIGWCPEQLNAWFRHQDDQRIVHVFTGQLTVPLQQLQLLEGQDMTLASTEQIRLGRLWSSRLKQERPLASALSMVVAKLDEITYAD